MKLLYPFEFDECLLDTDVLDQLGFGEYWGGSGDFGTRTLDLNDNELTTFLNIKLPHVRVCVMDKNEDGDYGCGNPKEFLPQRILSEDFKTNLYFFHDLYELVNNYEGPLGVTAFNVFRQICFNKNFGPYIESWEAFKEKQSKK